LLLLSIAAGYFYVNQARKTPVFRAFLRLEQFFAVFDAALFLQKNRPESPPPTPFISACFPAHLCHILHLSFICKAHFYILQITLGANTPKVRKTTQQFPLSRRGGPCARPVGCADGQ